MSKNINGSGYSLSEDTEFYENSKMVGAKVGEYYHSCHMGGSTIRILLIGYTKGEYKQKSPFILEIWDDHELDWGLIK